MDEIDCVELSKEACLRTSRLCDLQRSTPRRYLKAGAIYSCLLCDEDRPPISMDNAVDKIAGYMALTNYGP